MLVESVPNVSEGRRLDVVDRLAEAISSVSGVALLDRTSDASHNRSVFTMAGEDGPVTEALERLVAASIHEIDMDVHEGEHPRIGAVDVIPFIPLGSTTIDECIDLARRFGERVATRYDLPVYLYARAALRADREKLADVRRGQYEGLKEEIAHRGREPDFGPPRLHPSAGAVAVGARPFLIAYNINLDSDDVDLAKRIARRVRESGGAPACSATPRNEASGARPISSDSAGRTPSSAASSRTASHTRQSGVTSKSRRFIDTCARRGCPRSGSRTSKPFAWSFGRPPPDSRTRLAMRLARSTSSESRLML